MQTLLEIPVNLEFSVADLSLASDIKFRGIRARCERISAAPDHARCERGSLQIDHTPFGPVKLGAQYDWYPLSGKRQLHAQGRIGQGSHLDVRIHQRFGDARLLIKLQKFELQSAQDILGRWTQFFTDHEIDGGTISFTSDCTIRDSRATSCAAEGSFDALNINGVNVAENATLAFTGRYDFTSADFEFDLSLRDGAVYVEPGFTLGSVNPGFFLTATSDAPVSLGGHIARSPSSDTRILSAFLNHPDTVAMRFSGDLAFTPSLNWKSLDLFVESPDVARFYGTYMQPIALDTSFAELETRGSVTMALTGSTDEIDTVDINFDRIYIDDSARRFSLYGLDGDIVLHAAAEPRPSHISWHGGSLYDIQIGAGGIDWVSQERNLTVASWQDVAVFDGEFRMDTLAVEDVGIGDSRVTMAGRLTPITLSALTAAFGWIPLSGKLSGTIPRLSYAGGRLDMDGDLRVNVFDGAIVIRDLEIDKMFSTVPILSASVQIEQLDLLELTRTFSFGNITGRLNGAIDNLELQAWKPIRFDAEFATAEDDIEPHRISQQAVDNLGRLGTGSGTAMSRGWLGLIPSYSYGRLGIGCRLIAGHCEMRGVKDADDGEFYILTRGGILPPWIDIKGSGRRIRWQTLVDGIKQISTGEWELDIGS